MNFLTLQSNQFEDEANEKNLFFTKSNPTGKYLKFFFWIFFRK